MQQGEVDAKPGFLPAFEGLEDRRLRSCPHRLDELLLLALAAAGAATRRNKPPA